MFLWAESAANGFELLLNLASPHHFLLCRLRSSTLGFCQWRTHSVWRTAGPIYQAESIKVKKSGSSGLLTQRRAIMFYKSHTSQSSPVQSSLWPSPAVVHMRPLWLKKRPLKRRKVRAKSRQLTIRTKTVLLSLFGRREHFIYCFSDVRFSAG